MSGRIHEITAKEAFSEMKVGWNLGNTLDAIRKELTYEEAPTAYETCWFNPVTTEENIKTVLNAGFNLIRIPCSWGMHMDSENRVDPRWMKRVREIVDYAYDNGAWVMLNTHHDAFWLNTFEKDWEKGSERFSALWSQIADEFAGYDERLIFEGMNELRYPGTPIEWIGDDAGYEMVNRYNELFVRTIRGRSDANRDRLLVISTYCGASRNNVIKNYSVPCLADGTQDEKLFITVHCYDPEEFALRYPGTGTWSEADSAPIDDFFERVDRFLKPFDVPVILGEFAALKKYTDDNDECRIKWTEYMVRSAREHKVIPVWWDNGYVEGEDSMGILDRKTNTWTWPLLTAAVTGC